MKQNRAQLSRACQRLNGAQKSRQEVFCLPEPLDMSDDLVGFDSKAKAGRSFIDPFLDRGFFHQLAKGEIDFHGIKLRRIVD